MTIDKAKLKALAQAVADLEDIPEREDEHAEAVDALWLNMHCHTILVLLAEIERLEVDNGSMRGSTKRMGEDASRAQKQSRKAQREIDQLKAENEALRKDAERYRWLRNVESDVAIMFGGHGWEEMSHEYMDQAIDSVMVKEQSHGE